ncbi:sulfurtransferase [Falsiroseomonas sp. HW251]|uniref:sulfurtransferase n=1 Tax=Falsiroseomonas sp. HW251 TaxID=3390998 RepID=UPI003D31C256
MDPRAQVLATAEELGALIATGKPVSVLAVRNGPGDFAGAPRIPGAVDVDLPTELASPGGGTAGSRPLPAIDKLQADARRWGLRTGVPVVVYDHDRCLVAARGWWVLRWAGLSDVRLLDGGFPAWLAAGLPVATTPGAPPPSDVVLTPGGLPVMDADATARMAREGVLLDTRVRVNYIGGATPPGAPRRGHIPGSVSAPAADVLMEDGRFADAETLRHLFHALGADGSRPVGFTCGAGISAAHGTAALASIGVTAAMFPGSWSAWAADPDRPVVVGATPG